MVHPLRKYKCNQIHHIFMLVYLQIYNQISKPSLQILALIAQSRRLLFTLVCLFVWGCFGRLTQKLQNGQPQNLDGGRVLASNRPQ